MSNSRWVKKFGKLIIARHGDYRFHPRVINITALYPYKIFTVGIRFSIKGLYPRELRDWLRITQDKFFNDWGYLVVSINLFGRIYYIRWLHGYKCGLSWEEEKVIK